MKHLNKNDSTIPTLSMNGTEANTDQDKANMLNTFFSTCFNTSLPPLSVPDMHNNAVPSEMTPDLIESLLCTEEEVLHLLETIDVSKSSGPDGISGRMLKAVATSIAAPVTKLFNHSISTGTFPSRWKLSSVVPIPKSADKHNPGNYQPISLLPIK